MAGNEIPVKTWYITTPIYYPSDNLHIGHAYTTVAADALARYHRLLGDPVWFVTGTDEHGQKIEKRALETGLTPQSFVDRIVEGIRDPLWKSLGISYDDFIRTTEQRHIRVVQAAFERLLEKGDIYKGVYEGWYCLPDESFWPESKLVEGKCPDCGREVERVQAPSYFFRLSRYQDRIHDYILEHPDFIQPPSRRNEMLAFIESGLEDLSVSRAGLAWGVPVPGDPDHTVYVWFDALLNYLTAAGYLEDPERFARKWPADLHLVGKEIVRFHTVIWPIMLMALELPLPAQVFGHGWLLIDDTKMSKSRGNAVDPIELIQRYGVDPVRYYLLREVPFGSDGSYTEDALILRTNVDLANDLGNLLSRATAMMERYTGGRIPAYHTEFDRLDLPRRLVSTDQAYRAAMDRLDMPAALVELWKLVRELNKYLEDEAPWQLAAKPDATTHLETVLFVVAEGLRALSVWLTPFLIELPQEMRWQLGLSRDVAAHLEAAAFRADWSGTPVRRGEPLVPRIERRTGKDEAKPLDTEKQAPEASTTIGIEEFQRVELKVGTVVAADFLKGADRLLVLKVDDGERERTVVSGIRQHYEPSDLVGQQVVLVANLAPTKIRGVLSEGMLLAASDAEGLSLVAPTSRRKPGARVK